MFFLSPVALAGPEPSVAMLAVMPVSSGFMVCPPLLWPSQQPVESWSAIYRLAYEQFVIAFGPSRFQRAIEPSLN
jgi:hypothetical protein